MSVFMAKPFMRYFICSLLYFVWQTSNTLAANVHPLFGQASDYQLSVSVFTFHYLVGGISLIVMGFICDRVIRSGNTRRLLAAGMMAMAGLLTILRLTDLNISAFITLHMAGTFFGFGAYAIILGGLFSEVPYATRPLCYGAAFSAAILLRMPIDLYGAEHSHTAYILLGSVALIVLAVVLSSPYVKTGFEVQKISEPVPRKDNPRLLLMAIGCSLVVYVLFGIVDELTTGSSVMLFSVSLIRLTQIIFSILAGLICYRWGHYAAVLGSVSLLGIGTLAFMFSYSGPGGLICSIASVAGLQLFLGPIRALFADLGLSGKYPYTVTALGFATYFLFQIIGIPIANLIDQLGNTGGMTLYIALFMLTIPVIIVFFHILRSSHVNPATQEPLAQIETLGLTRREKEIMALVLGGRLSREIAEELFVSESTVNWHVANILKKTGAKSRAKLIEMYQR